MAAQELLEEADSVLEELRVFSYTDDLIDSVMAGGDDIELDEVNLESLAAATEQPRLVERLLEILTELRDSDVQEAFWDRLSAQGISPAIFQAFCFALFNYSSSLQRFGVLIYTTLLGMQPLSILWNQKFFTSVLSIMITASQAIEESKVVSRDESKAIKISAQIIDVLSKVISPEFEKLAGVDVVLALIELAVKFSTIYQKELEKYARMLMLSAMTFLDAAATCNLKIVLPSIVLSLLLDFLPSTKAVTVSVTQIRENFLGLCAKHLVDSQDDLLLVMKHLLMRSPERASMRENTAIVVHRLLALLEAPAPIFQFLAAMSRTTRSSHRTLALDVIGKLVEDADRPLPEDVKHLLLDAIKFGVRDQVPAVRASALSAVTVVVPRADDETWRAIPLEQDLVKRIVDEKLAVRKAALKCLRAIVTRDPNCSFDLYVLIAERTRDRSVAMRQEAATTLSNCLNRRATPQLIELWFDSVLPLALDSDTRAQELALKLLNECLFSVIADAGLDRVEYLTSSRLDLLRKVLPVYKLKGFSLKPLCVSLEKMLSSDCPPVLWSLAEALISITPEHFRRDYSKLWDVRNDLPAAYYAILVILKWQTDRILHESKELLHAVATGAITVASFAILHSTVQYVANAGGDIFPELLDVLNARTNRAARDETLTHCDMVSLTSAIFLMGELFRYVGHLNDYDFTGLQLMISTNLPNKQAIPTEVRTVSTISLGKLCLWRRDMSSSFVAAFAAQLHQSGSPEIKCNCLIVLCDLCVKWTATVDPYVMNMSACFADESPIVRRQTLLIMTRLISEDYVKIRPLIFFRFVFCLVDRDEELSKFAESCLFDVLMLKEPKLMSQHFLDSLFYFNDHIDPGSLNEDVEFHQVFRISNKEKRRRAYTLIIGRMSNSVLFELLQTSCDKILQSFINGNIELDEGESLLSDALDVMLKIECQMEATNVSEANTDDPRSEKIVEQSKLYLGLIHDQLIQRVLPILNQMHRLLRAHRSPLQSDLRRFFRTLCQRHPSLLKELRRQEPILAAELEHDMALTPTPAVATTPPTSPLARTPFRSPLLSRIARTPQLTMIQETGVDSPVSRLSQRADTGDEAVEKRPPVPFSLDDD
jgi:condensin-2 complex subunit D3